MPQRPDSAAVPIDSATMAAWRAAGREPVPLRVTEVRELPTPFVLALLAGALTLGLLLGVALGYWWRARRQP